MITRIKDSINSIGFWALCGVSAMLTICFFVSVFAGDEVVGETKDLKDKVLQTTTPPKNQNRHKT